MISTLLLALTLASTPLPNPAPDPTFVRDAAQAIEAGRLEQARLMIARAVGAGEHGPALEKLMADLAFQRGNYEEAVSRYDRLINSGTMRDGICERAAVAALQLGRLDQAQSYAKCATQLSDATWRAWNSLAVVADRKQDWDAADRAYARAHELAPKNAAVVNNQGWSQLLRGDWAAALPLFEQAAALDPNSRRIADNLELARAALAPDLPKRLPNEEKRDWAERLNDAGVAAELNGNRQKAMAAFTQALQASDTWYQRASDNLEAVSKE